MPLRIVWSALARSRLQEIYECIGMDKPAAAERLAIRIVAAVQVLRRHPYVGRIGRESGTRDLVIGKAPYIVAYEIRHSEVRITMIWHGAQNRTT